MSNTHTIPTVPGYDNEPGHFKSQATLLIAGSSRAGGPGGWFVGGWTAEGEGRTETGGPMIVGPYAYVGGRCSVIDNHGGTGADLKRADEDSLLFRCAEGDTLVLHDTSYTLDLNPRGYPHLTPIQA